MDTYILYWRLDELYQLERLKKMNKKIWKFILLVFFISFLFLKLWVPFGKSPSKKDRLNYAARAKNFKHHKFRRNKKNQ